MHKYDFCLNISLKKYLIYETFFRQMILEMTKTIPRYQKTFFILFVQFLCSSPNSKLNTKHSIDNDKKK